MKEEQLKKGNTINKKLDALKKILDQQESALEVDTNIEILYSNSQAWRVTLFTEKSQVEMLISLAIANTKKEIKRLEKELEAI